MLISSSQAINGASLILDTVSLLLAKDHNSLAAATVAAHPRDKGLIGTFGMSKNAVVPPSAAQRSENEMIAKGWKMQNLTKSVDSILASATRLEKEIEGETKYWEQVLAISEGGWSVCRIPNANHALGVTFGFSESAPSFKNRAIAALQRDAEGNISLDQGTATTLPQSLRVRIRTQVNDLGLEYTGSTVVPIAIPRDAPVESLILQSRNTLFAEELWHEINREARSLTGLGVRSREGTVSFPLSPTKTVVLDIVPLAEDYTMPTGPDDKIAEGISLALHLLLCFVHRQNLRIRTRPPPFLTTVKRATQPYTLTRAILTRLGHQNTIASAEKFCSTLNKLLKSAGLPSSYGSTPAIITEAMNSLPEMSPTESTLFFMVDRLSIKTSFHVTENVTINITSRSTWSIPGTIHFVSLAPVDCPLIKLCKPPPSPLDTWNKVEDYILFATSCALASSLAAASSVGQTFPATKAPLADEGWQSTIQPNVLRRRFDEVGGNKQLFFLVQKVAANGNIPAQLTATVKWEWLGEQKIAKGNGSYTWIEKLEESGPGEARDDNELQEVIRSWDQVIADAGSC